MDLKIDKFRIKWSKRTFNICDATDSKTLQIWNYRCQSLRSPMDLKMDRHGHHRYSAPTLAFLTHLDTQDSDARSDRARTTGLHPSSFLNFTNSLQLVFVIFQIFCSEMSWIRCISYFEESKLHCLSEIEQVQSADDLEPFACKTSILEVSSGPTERLNRSEA